MNEAVTSEDCAIHGATAEAAWGIVSDGCSDGGRTDFGSRMWALKVEEDLGGGDSRLIAALKEGKAIGPVVAGLAPSEGRGLALHDLLATVVFVVATPQGVWGALAGDGALVAVYDDGFVDVITHEFTKRRPAYPQLLTSESRISEYVMSCKAGYQRLLAERLRYGPGSNDVRHDRQEIPIDAGNAEFGGKGYRFEDHSSGPKKGDLRAVIALTDGVFTRAGKSWVHTLRELVGTADWDVGEQGFLRRRLKKASHQWWETNSIPADDLSAAGVAWKSRDLVETVLSEVVENA